MNTSLGNDTFRPPQRIRKKLLTLTYEVSSENRFQRRLLVEILRNFGIKNIFESARPEDHSPHGASAAEVILWEWRQLEIAWLGNICKPRFNWRPAVIVIDSIPSAERVAMIVAAGASGVIARPFAANAVLSHIVHAVATRTQEYFID